jgi:hypothetical protein
VTQDGALDVMDRTFVECSALGFQSVVTSVLAIACVLLWQRERGAHFLTWGVAWSVYVVRLACMSAFLVRRDMVWLFVHQAATGVSALLLLAAALQMSRGLVLRPVHALALPVAIAWAWVTVYGMGSMIAGGISATLLLSSVTLWTGVIFWRARHRVSSGAAPVLAGAFVLWGLHHLDYPLRAASAPRSSTASSPMSCSCSRSASACSSSSSATNATGWRRVPPSSSSSPA